MTLQIPLLSRYVSGVSPISARVELGRRDGWKTVGSGEGKELSVLTAFIKGTVRPQGIRLVPSRLAPRNVHRFPTGASSRGSLCCLALLPPPHSSQYHSSFWQLPLFPPFGGNMVQPLLRLERVPVRELYQMQSVRGEFENDH